MISFIIIGLNEGWKLNKCIDSVRLAIKENCIVEYEIIYVDSNSTDDSLQNSKKYNDVITYQLTGICNAAIARNVGAENAKGDILFFIDGDMEINSEFLRKSYIGNKNLIYDFVSGDFCNIEYDNNHKIISKELYHKNQTVVTDFKTGGLFLIKKSIWLSVNGMRNEFKRSQDIDLGIRLAQKGIFIYRLPIIAAQHFTIPYWNKKRKWKMLFDNSNFYGRCYLYRKNIFNKYSWMLMLSQDYSMLILLLSLILFILSSSLLPYLIFSYLIIIIIRAYKRKPNTIGLDIFEDAAYYLVRDFMQLIGLFAFFPKSVDPAAIKYQLI